MNTITQTKTLPDGRTFRCTLEIYTPSPINPTPFVKVRAVQVDEDGAVLLDRHGMPNMVNPDPIGINLTNLANGTEVANDGYVEMQQMFGPESLEHIPDHDELPMVNEGSPIKVAGKVYQWKMGIYSLIIENVLAQVPTLNVADTLTSAEVNSLLGLTTSGSA